MGPREHALGVTSTGPGGGTRYELISLVHPQCLQFRVFHEAEIHGGTMGWVTSPESSSNGERRVSPPR